jgi:hypothetical protein
MRRHWPPRAKGTHLQYHRYPEHQAYMVKKKEKEKRRRMKKKRRKVREWTE